MSRPPTAAATFRLFVRLRVRRMLNTLSSRSRWKGKGRKGTAKKPSTSWLLTLFVGVMLTIGFFSIHLSVLSAIKSVYPRTFSDPAYLRMVASFLFLTSSAAVLMTLGNREFAKAEWDLEWLITLPISKGRLMGMRLAERTIVNPASFLAAFPLFTLLWVESGMVNLFWAPVLGFVCSLPVMLIIAVVQTVIDTGLRVHLRPSQVRNLQALFNISGVAAFYLTIMQVRSEVAPAIRWTADWIGPHLLFLPPGLSIVTIANFTFAAPALLAVELAAFAYGGYVLLLYLLRGGIIAGSGQNAGLRGQSLRANATPAAPASLAPMLVKELRLLARDRNYMVQTLLLPILIIGVQVYLQSDGGRLHEVSLSRVGVTAFGMITYAMMFSVLNLLSSEGASLWILYTLPRPIKSLVIEKAKAWFAVSLVYWVAFAGFAAIYKGFTPEFFWKMGLALAGVPVFLVLAMALGIFSFNPHVEEAERRLRPGIVYLYMLIAGSYSVGFFRDEIWSTVVGVILVAMVAYAFWQKAARHLPYLLDPIEAPPARVSLADGMIAVYAFFVLQLLFQLLFSFGRAQGEASTLLYAFALAGLITCGLALFHFRRTKTEGVPTYRTFDYPRALLFGTLTGLAGGVFAHVYLEFIERMGWFSDLVSQGLILEKGERWWLSVLAVFAAPVFEEFIFRGLVFAGLAQTVRPSAALAGSALLFAAVHPPMSVVPVFVMGLGTAMLYRWQGSLLPSTLAHAVYNFCVLLVPWLAAR